MAKVIVFHFTDKGKLPKLSEEELSALSKKIREEVKKHPGVKFHGTYVNEEGMGICDWEAPYAEKVNEIIEKVLGAPPVDGAIVVKKVL